MKSRGALWWWGLGENAKNKKNIIVLKIMRIKKKMGGKNYEKLRKLKNDGKTEVHYGDEN